MLHWLYAISQSLFWLQSWYFANIYIRTELFHVHVYGFYLYFCFIDLMIWCTEFMTFLSLYRLGPWYLACIYWWTQSFYHHQSWMHSIGILASLTLWYASLTSWYFSVPIWVRAMIHGTHLHMDKNILTSLSMNEFDLCFMPHWLEPFNTTMAVKVRL